jgi:pimeloyl-ACP methyl ester carboxylesterase
MADALDELTRHRLVLFGHSMGASVAHKPALRLEKRECPPAALCVRQASSASAGPGERGIFLSGAREGGADEPTGAVSVPWSWPVNEDVLPIWRQCGIALAPPQVPCNCGQLMDDAQGSA